MEKLEIVKFPSPILRKKCALVNSEKIKQLSPLVKQMASVMKNHNGVGLAAPQVGVNIQLIIIDTKDGIVALFNPKIKKFSWKKETEEEGCLSLPEIFGQVKRSFKITVLAMDTDGKKIVFEAKGLFARIIQHEIDHINGVLFIDKAKKITQGKDKLKQLADLASALKRKE